MVIKRKGLVPLSETAQIGVDLVKAKTCINCGAPLHSNICDYCGTEYEIDDEEQIKDYLQAFESEEIELSVRNSVPIFDLYVKE